jgi:hypothetical protein
MDTLGYANSQGHVETLHTGLPSIPYLVDHYIAEVEDLVRHDNFNPIFDRLSNSE